MSPKRSPRAVRAWAETRDGRSPVVDADGIVPMYSSARKAKQEATSTEEMKHGPLPVLIVPLVEPTEEELTSLLEELGEVAGLSGLPVTFALARAAWTLGARPAARGRGRK